jgi:cytosine/adenosine deaminase-related metal-dependent hydrolase
MPARAKPELNMFAEMRAFALAQPDVAPSEILRMATQGGARALGWQDRVGGLFPHALADLITIPFNGKKEEAYAAVVHHNGPVSASLIDGQWVFPPSSQP